MEVSKTQEIRMWTVCRILASCLSLEEAEVYFNHITSHGLCMLEDFRHAVVKFRTNNPNLVIMSAKWYQYCTILHGITLMVNITIFSISFFSCESSTSAVVALLHLPSPSDYICLHSSTDGFIMRSCHVMYSDSYVSYNISNECSITVS